MGMSERRLQFMLKQWYYEFPIGLLGIVESRGAIARIHLGKRCQQEKCPFDEEETPLLRRAADELKEYFSGLRSRFDLPLDPEGTQFQCAVWQALTEIPCGETRTYAQIAARVGRPRACRAVGMANHSNPVMIVIPCHRVVGSNGSLTGYASGLPVKEYLLGLERGESPLFGPSENMEHALKA